MSTSGLLKMLVWPMTVIAALLIFKAPIADRIGQIAQKDAGSRYAEVKLSDSVGLYDFIEARNIDQRFLAAEIPQANSSFFTQGKSECSQYVLYDNEGIDLEDEQLFYKINDINSLIRKSILCGQFKGLIVVDKQGAFIGTFDRDYFLESVIYWDSYPQFAERDQINQKLSWLRKHVHYAPALMYPQNMLDQNEGSTLFLQESATVQSAIETLLNTNVRFAPILNDRKQVVGILSKERIIDQLFREFLRSKST